MGWVLPLPSESGTYKTVEALAVRKRSLTRFKFFPLCSEAGTSEAVLLVFRSPKSTGEGTRVGGSG